MELGLGDDLAFYGDRTGNESPTGLCALGTPMFRGFDKTLEVKKTPILPVLLSDIGGRILQIKHISRNRAQAYKSQL